MVSPLKLTNKINPQLLSIPSNIDSTLILPKDPEENKKDSNLNIKKSFVSATTTFASCDFTDNSSDLNIDNNFSNLKNYYSKNFEELKIADVALTPEYPDIIRLNVADEVISLEFPDDFTHRLNMINYLNLDTLFFVFYYFPNTLYQHFCAHALKRQNWRFNKKYLTWFKRFDKPSIVTPDYEYGNYIFFDYEKTWCQRKKIGFKFEYEYKHSDESP